MALPIDVYKVIRAVSPEPLLHMKSPFIFPSPMDKLGHQGVDPGFLERGFRCLKGVHFTDFTSF